MDLTKYQSIDLEVAQRLLQIVDNSLVLRTDTFDMHGVPITDDEWLLYYHPIRKSEDQEAARLSTENLILEMLTAHQDASPCSIRNYIWVEYGLAFSEGYKKDFNTPLQKVAGEVQNHRHHEPLFDW